MTEELVGMGTEQKQPPSSDLFQTSAELTESELMTLAGRISSTAMQIIAVQKLGFGISEVKTLSSGNREDHWMMKFELLDRWKNRNRRNSRQKLASLLLEVSSEEGIIDANMVEKILKTGNATPATTEFSGNKDLASQLEEMRLKLERETSKSTQLQRKVFELDEKLKQFQEKEREGSRGDENWRKLLDQEERLREIHRNKAYGFVELGRKSNEKEEKLEINARKAKQIQRANIVGQTTAPGKQNEEYQLQLLSTHETDIDWCLGFTVMPRSGDVVASGRDKGGLISLFVFSLKDIKLKETKRLRLSCGHRMEAYLSSMIVDDREKVVVSCYDCDYIKLVDPKTGEWSTVFPCIKPYAFCSGGSGTIYVRSLKGSSILQLDSTGLDFKGPIRTVHPYELCIAMCYIPPPLDIIVLCNSQTLVAMSVCRDKVIWMIRGPYSDIKFDPEHNVLLSVDGTKGRVIIVNPENGTIIQIIKLPGMGFIRAFDLQKNKLVMFHTNYNFKISYLNLL